MEKIVRGGEFSRRSFVRACIGGLAAMHAASEHQTTVAAPPSETYGGGRLCTAPPNLEGTQTLETIHEAAQDTQNVDRYEVAERLGLTLVPREARNETYEALRTASNIHEGSSILGDYTEEWFGFPAMVNPYGRNERAKAVLNNPNFSINHLFWTVNYLSMLPREFYDAINFSNLLIEDVPEDRAGDYHSESWRIRLDPTVLDNPSTLFHELGHASNMTLCGLFPDTALSNTLPKDVNYNEDWQSQDNWQGIFASSYGQKNELEDAATVIEYWMTGRIALEDHLKGTPLYDKLAIIMDRFETLVPGLVEYIEEAVRPEFEHMWAE